MKLAEREEQHRQRDPNEPFTGVLATKTKGDLQDIVQALELAINGQRKDLLARINSHFDENPLLRENPQLEGISYQSCQQPAENHLPQDHPPPTPSASVLAPPTVIPAARPYFGTAPHSTNDLLDASSTLACSFLSAICPIATTT
ncbi:hypothetical protein EDB87DRAFT_1680123 [Lactarius vividus]|nr:hypothetical protein EDB87DRAFT_1680123 [Lactarius vividus]